MNSPLSLSISYPLFFIFFLCLSIVVNACALSDRPEIPLTPMSSEEENIATALGQRHSVYRTDIEECKQAVENGELEVCVGLSSIDRFTQLDLEQLFPNTEFYLIRIVYYYHDREEPTNRIHLLAWQGNHFYEADTFDDLLGLNNIRVTDENRELVAKTFALMTLTDHLKDEVVFTGWEAGEWPQAAYPYNYCLTAWTKIQGLNLEWCFVFKDDYLSIASGAFPIDSEAGDYIEPDYEIPRVRFNDYCFEDYCS